MKGNEMKAMENTEEIYRMALERIKILTLNIAENFEQGDDEVSHYLEKVYDVLDKVIPM